MPGVTFDRMPTYKKCVETTSLRCKKCLSDLKAMDAKGIEQCHLFLLYQSVVLIVIDYGLSLTTVAVPERRAGQYWVILGATKDTSTEIMRFMLHLLDLPPMQTRQKVEQVKAFFNAVENPHNLHHERRKGMQTWMWQVLDGSTRGISTARVPPDRNWAKQGVGNVPKLISTSLTLWDTNAKNLGKALSRMASRENGVRD